MRTIKYPRYISQFEVQANLYMILFNWGKEVRGNVKSWCYDGGRRHRVYLDLVVFSKSKEPIVIIECKNRRSSARKLGARQKRRYESFGIPLVVCWNNKDVWRAANEVRDKEEAFEEIANQVKQRKNTNPKCKNWPKCSCILQGRESNCNNQQR